MPSNLCIYPMAGRAERYERRDNMALIIDSVLLVARRGQRDGNRNLGRLALGLTV